MKPLLILLFCVSVAAGQTREAQLDSIVRGRVYMSWCGPPTTTPPQSAKRDTLRPSTQAERQRRDSIYFDWGRIYFLLRLWDSYHAECYADSTITVADFGVRDITEKERDSLRLAHPDWNLDGDILVQIPITKTIHRSPSFEGFMEYLRKKQ